eukprot:contig_10054_g2399
MALTSRNTNLVHKAEFLFHTLPSLCYAATVLFQLYFPLAIFVNTNFSWPWLGVNLGALAIFWAFYTLTLYRMLGFWKGLANQWRIAGIMVLCWGLSPLLAYAFVEGMFSHDATFTRTPKRAATVSATDSMSTNVTGTSQSAYNESDTSEVGVAARPAPTPRTDGSQPSPQTSEHSSAVGEMASVSGATTLTAMTSSLTSEGDSSGSLTKKVQSSAKSSYFTTKITFLPFFEFAVAMWSLFAAVAAVFGLAGAPIHENFNRGVLWLTAVAIFSTGCAVGLLWSSLGAIGGMIQGLYMDFTANRETSATASAEASDPSTDMDMSPTDVPNVAPDQSTSSLSLFTAIPAPVDEEVAPVSRLPASAAPPDVAMATSLRGRGGMTVVEV